MERTKRLRRGCVRSSRDGSVQVRFYRAHWLSITEAHAIFEAEEPLRMIVVCQSGPDQLAYIMRLTVHVDGSSLT
jgi:hypothetical protein